MTLIQKLHEIEKRKSIYDIHYCRAGIGFIFYEPPKDFEYKGSGDKWKKYLNVNKYYKSFEEAVNNEFKRL